MAGRGPDERLGRLAHLDRGEVKARPSGFPEERPERRNATSGAPEGPRAVSQRHAGAFTRCPVVTQRPNRRSHPSLEGKKKKTGARAPQITPERGSVP